MLSAITQFGKIRVEARAYLTYLLTRNLPNHTPNPDFETLLAGMKKIEHEVEIIDALYILDPVGNQVIDNISKNSNFRRGKGENRSNRAYYYRAVREKKPILTDPYPSALSGELCISASMPIYTDKNKLAYIAVLDVPLDKITKIIHPTKLDETLMAVSRISYTMFATVLFGISMLLLFKGLVHLTYNGLDPHHIDLKDIFESTILLTLALAIFDLVKAIFEEEVLGRSRHKDEGSQIHRTMTRFMGSIIIAIAIEALMLVFKSTLIDPSKLIFAVYLLGGVTLLLFGLAFYIKSVTGSTTRDGSK